MITALIGLPLVAGVLAFVLPGKSLRRGLWVSASLAHAALTAACLASPPPPTLSDWLELDALGRVFLTVASVLFLAASSYGIAYLRREERTPNQKPERVFIGCSLLFLSAMTLITASQHMGVLWVAVEATTLASAPLIYFHRNGRSLEAAWKYLLICSVGIALALLGTLFLAVSIPEGTPVPLVVKDLIRQGSALQTPWVKAAFLFLLVGYGTKMGLAPLHTWLPDAHSEAPSPVSALLSGALLNCAFLGILRGLQICTAAGEGGFAKDLLCGFGLLSMAVAAVFLLRPLDFKRMLAYSSVEHMGILSVGVGLGGIGTPSSFFHAVNHSLAKGMLFLVAGNIVAAWNTKAVSQVRGVLRAAPLTGVLWLAGFLAVTGSPPFGTFLSEFTILRAALVQERGGVAVVYLAALSLAFVGMAGAFLRMAQGRADRAVVAEGGILGLAAPAILGIGVLLLGLYVPPPLSALFDLAARTLGAVP